MVQKQTEFHTDGCSLGFQHYALVTHSFWRNVLPASLGQTNWFGWVLKGDSDGYSCVLSWKFKVVWPITAMES